MQSELFQNFINSISLLTKEQRTILESVLSNIQSVSSDEMYNGIDEKDEEIDEITDFEPSASTSSTVKQLPASDLEANILSRFAECPRCPRCVKVGTLEAGDLKVDDSVTIAKLATKLLTLIRVHPWQG